MNRNRAYSIVVLVLMVVPLLSLLLPVVQIPVVHATRGGLRLAAVSCDLATLTCTDIRIADYNVSIRAGSSIVVKVDGEELTGTWYLALVFWDNETGWYVELRGEKFDLYMNTHGYSERRGDDIPYAVGFERVDLLRTPPKTVEIENDYLLNRRANFTIGSFTIGDRTYALIIGPIPFDITAEYKYIAVYDGTIYAVAVGSVEILGSVSLTPTLGPGGKEVSIEGVALLPNRLINLTYVTSPGTPEEQEIVFAQVWTDAKGRFKYTFRIVDLKQGWTGFNNTIPSDTVYIRVRYNLTGAIIGTVDCRTELEYTQYRRAFVELRSVRKGHVAQRFVSLYQGSGNDTLTVQAFVYDTIVLAGAWWNPSEPVRVYIGRTLIATATPNETHGFFRLTFTVPELPIGTHTVNVTQEGVGVWYVFYLRVLPTLVLTPDSGPVGTLVEARVYGFPANATIGLYWLGCAGWTLLGSFTTGPDGRFNVTATFRVPVDYGGAHTVRACRLVGGACIEDIVNVTFTVLPSIEITPAVTALDGGTIVVRAFGLGSEEEVHVVVDNQLMYPSATCHRCGNLTVHLVAAGFRPGLHVVSIYRADEVSFIRPVLNITFRVLCTGDEICDRLVAIAGRLLAVHEDVLVIRTGVSEIRAKITELEPVIMEIRGNTVTLLTRIGGIEADLATIRSLIESGNAVLVAINGTVATIKTDVGTIKADLGVIKPVITAISGDVATIKTDVGTIKANLTTIRSLVESGNAVLVAVNGTVATIRTDVGTIKADVGAIKPTITAISGDVATIKTDIGTIKADVSALRPVVTEINDGVAKVQTTIGELKGVVEAINDNVAVVRTDVGTIKADVSDIKGRIPGLQSDVAGIKGEVSAIKSDVSGVKESTNVIPTLSAAVWVAVAFSIIAAAVSAFVAITVRRKIAG
ncbi:MAG: hypothetical protein QXK07_07750 [Desulfurococcaceae archaeon]